MGGGQGLWMKGVQKKGLRCVCVRGAGVSQGHSGAGVFELAGQHSSVELVELHQLNQVGEFGGAVVKAEENLAVLFTLAASKGSGVRASGDTTDVERKEKVKNRFGRSGSLATNIALLSSHHFLLPTFERSTGYGRYFLIKYNQTHIFKVCPYWLALWGLTKLT